MFCGLYGTESTSQIILQEARMWLLFSSSINRFLFVQHFSYRLVQIKGLYRFVSLYAVKCRNTIKTFNNKSTLYSYDVVISLCLQISTHSAGLSLFFYSPKLIQINTESCRYSKLTCVKSLFVCAVAIEKARSLFCGTNLKRWTMLWVTLTAVLETVATLKKVMLEAGK